MTRRNITITLTVTVLALLFTGLITVFAGVSTVGDFVWFDENGDGVKNEGPEWGDSGIDGVLVNLYLDNGTDPGVFDSGDTLKKQMYTGDNPSTTGVEHGWYDFTEVGDHLGWWVEIPDSNFDHGGPLEGYEYTGDIIDSNDYNGPNPRYVYIPDTLTDHNDADFGYTLKDIVAIGNLVWADSNGDSQVSSGEVGIEGVTVKLYRDADGDGISEPGGDDGSSVMTTATDSNGIYQFLNVTPSVSGDPTTNYFVAVVTDDVKNKGFANSSSGGGQNPDSGDDVDDGVPAGDYVVSQPFSATKGGQSTTSDSGDPTGYADSSSYMTVDFGFTTASFNAVSISSIKASGNNAPRGFGWGMVGIIGLGTFVWSRRKKQQA